MRIKGLICAACLCATAASGDVAYSLYGLEGHLDMPNALPAPDGELSFSLSHVGKTQRSTLAFQITPRLTGAFRYGHIGRYTSTGADTYDRSFDVRYVLFPQTERRPAIAVGLQDFIGTGLYAAEYLAATKDFGPVQATVGLGWGRLGSYNAIGAFGSRQSSYTGNGGLAEVGRWFQGDFAPFAGVTWAVGERLSVKAEYSSDAQELEVSRGHFDRKSPLNFGLDYHVTPRTQLSLYYMHGSELGASLSFALDPKNSSAGPSRDGVPVPIVVRPKSSAANLGWTNRAQEVSEQLGLALAPVFKETGLVLEDITLSGTRAVVHVHNTRYGAQAQAVGRAARLLAVVSPASIEDFDIILMEKGIAVSKVSVRRSDLERLEHAADGTAQMRQAAVVTDAHGAAGVGSKLAQTRQRFTWSFKPYLAGALFDPTNPLRADTGMELRFQWTPKVNLFVDGQIRQRAFGNLNASSRYSDSVLPHVRSDANFYDKANGPVLERLTGSYYFRPAPNTYGRVSAGYLERHYGGLSTELLWKPVHSRLALGVELNQVAQRSWDGLGFTPKTVVSTDSDTDAGYVGGTRRYNVLTGHASAYYAFASGFHARLDVGRYLAGDWGATVHVDREFNNGWRVGAYATLTDVSFDDFGEGSFDKGIVISIPFDWQVGTPSRRQTGILIQPLLRDGGARVKVQGRLYETVRDSHTPMLEDRWSRFWR